MARSYIAVVTETAIDEQAAFILLDDVVRLLEQRS